MVERNGRGLCTVMSDKTVQNQDLSHGTAGVGATIDSRKVLWKQGGEEESHGQQIQEHPKCHELRRTSIKYVYLLSV
jgi:hypothetical protein